jgi:hypothetical protein
MPKTLRSIITILLIPLLQIDTAQALTQTRLEINTNSRSIATQQWGQEAIVAALAWGMHPFHLSALPLRQDVRQAIEIHAASFPFVFPPLMSFLSFINFFRFVIVLPLFLFVSWFIARLLWYVAQEARHPSPASDINKQFDALQRIRERPRKARPQDLAVMDRHLAGDFALESALRSLQALFQERGRASMTPERTAALLKILTGDKLDPARDAAEILLSYTYGQWIPIDWRAPQHNPLRVAVEQLPARAREEERAEGIGMNAFDIAALLAIPEKDGSPWPWLQLNFFDALCMGSAGTKVTPAITNLVMDQGARKSYPVDEALRIIDHFIDEGKAETLTVAAAQMLAASIKGQRKEPTSEIALLKKIISARPELVTPALFEAIFSWSHYQRTDVSFHVLQMCLPLAYPSETNLVDFLIARLKSRDELVREQSTHLLKIILAQQPDEEITPSHVATIFRLAQDTRADVREAAYTTIEDLATEPQKHPLSADEFSDERRPPYLFDTAQISVVMSGRQDGNPKVAQIANRVFNQIVSSPSAAAMTRAQVQPLLDKLTETDPSAFLKAASDVIELGNGPAAELITEADLQPILDILLTTLSPEWRHISRTEDLSPLGHFLSEVIRTLFNYRFSRWVTMAHVEAAERFARQAVPDSFPQLIGINVLGAALDGPVGDRLAEEPVDDGSFLRRLMRFGRTASNASLRDVKMEFAGHLADIFATPAILDTFIAYVDETVSRSTELSFYRLMNTVLSKRVLTRNDSANDWKTFLGDYVSRFGVLANRDLVLIHRALFNKMPLDDPWMVGMRVAELGLTATGIAGIEQLQTRLAGVTEQLVREKGIDPDHMSHPVMEALVGGAVGFFSGQWSHGRSNFISLKEFINKFYENVQGGWIKPIDAWYRHEHSFIVRGKGKIDFTVDETAKFKEFERYATEADELLRTSAAEAPTVLRDRAVGLLQTELLKLEKKAPSADRVSAMAQHERQKNSLLDLIERLHEPSLTPRALTVLLARSPVTRRLATHAVFVAAFLQFPEVRESLLAAIKRGPETGVQALREFRTNAVGEELLRGAADDEREVILGALPMDIFSKQLKRITAIEEGAETVRAFATRGILGELAGDIGDACYTNVENIMERERPSKITAVIFTTGHGFQTEFVGSMLVLENTFEGKPVLIVRGLNPTPEFLATHSAEDFINGALEFLTIAAQKRGDGTKIVAPLHDLGALSNRPEVHSAFDAFKIDGDVFLDIDENFNDHPLRKIEHGNPKKIVEPMAPQAPVTLRIIHPAPAPPLEERRAA